MHIFESLWLMIDVVLGGNSVVVGFLSMICVYIYILQTVCNKKVVISWRKFSSGKWGLDFSYRTMMAAHIFLMFVKRPKKSRKIPGDSTKVGLQLNCLLYVCLILIVNEFKMDIGCGFCLNRTLGRTECTVLSWQVWG